MLKNKNSEVKQEIDETIKSVCKKVKEENVCLEEYAKTVEALASLVKARALID